ncbi:MAG TPA: mechanosensitive ion channel domain-containing protein [Haploplasma sp.]|nr:mechanosensitive ion channel domain-containing protein [Haploplasma sp.]
MSQYLRDLLRELFSKLIGTESIVNLIVAIIMVIYWIIIAYVVFKIVKLVLGRTKSFKRKNIETKEQLTVKRLLNNIVKAMFMFWIVIMILKELGIDIMPLLAGAGVLAFAVGFGAQELIKDVISGMFLILEKTLKIDDVVTINGIKGTVMEVGIRRTKVLTWKNELVTFNNGDIRTVINFSLNPGVAVIEFNLDPRFDLDLLYNDKFQAFLENFKNNNDLVLTMPGLPVILDMDNLLRFRITMQTEPTKAASVERSFRKNLYSYFVENDITIEIPVVIGHVSEEVKN